MIKFFSFILIIIFTVLLSCSKEDKKITLTNSADLDNVEKFYTVSLDAKRTDLWLAQGNDSLSILYFYADWCQFCQQFKPILLNAVSSGNTPIRIGFINADKQKAIIKKFGISSLPTIKFYKKNRLIYTSVGSLKPKELQLIIDKICKS